MRLSELRKVTPRLTVGHLEIIAADWAGRAHGDAYEDVIVYALAVESLRYFLGDAWTNEVAMHLHHDVSRQRKLGRDFMRTNELDDMESQAKHKQKVVWLAESLFNLQETPGFFGRLEMLQDDPNLEATFGEIRCASIFSHPDFRLRFVDPSKVRGSDYEAEFALPTGETVCCEIKTKSETTAITESTIRSTVSKARDQLPPDRPGVVVLSIPDHWATPDGARIANSAINRVLRRSNRIVAVVVCWTEWKRIEGSGWGFVSRFAPVYNTRSSFYSEQIETLIGRAGKLKNTEYIRFREIAISALASVPTSGIS
jgi:hypothetical protein